MNLVDRVKNILITPRTEWLVVATETTTPKQLLVSYVVPLAALNAAGVLLRGLIIGGTYGIGYDIANALVAFITTIAGYFIATYIIDALAPTFSSEKNINRSAQLVAYSSTAAWIGGFFNLIPIIGGLIALAGAIYTIYLLYLGIGLMKKTPEDKKVAYMIISFLLMIVVGMIIGAILGAIVYRSMGYGAYSMWRY